MLSPTARKTCALVEYVARRRRRGRTEALGSLCFFLKVDRQASGNEKLADGAVDASAAGRVGGRDSAFRSTSLGLTRQDFIASVLNGKNPRKHHKL